MPIKHQAESYRNRNGVRFVCDGDILDEAKGDLKQQAKARVKELRVTGRKAFYEKQGSYFRVFAEDQTVKRKGHSTEPLATPHTPGPWSIGTGITGPRAAITVWLDEHGPYECVRTPPISGDAKTHHLVAIVPHGEGDAVADARLIAAAPELLEALELLIAAALEPKGPTGWVCSVCRHAASSGGCENHTCPSGKARAILAQVRGNDSKERT